jgi:hypothetical protein
LEILSLPFSATTNITEAGLEPDEPQVCTFADRTIWYRYMPTETKKIRVDGVGGVNANVSIYRADGLGISDLQFLECAGPGSLTEFLAEAGQTYYLQAGAAFGETGLLQINLEQVPAISGRITDAITGEPMPFAQVTLQRICGDGCLEFIGSQSPNFEGTFVFDNHFGSPLAAGIYQIEVSADLYQTKQFGPFEFNGSHLDTGNLAIEPLPPIGSISGRVIDAVTGKPVLQTFIPSVRLYRCTDGNCFRFVSEQIPDSQGGFRFETDASGNPLPVGTYQIVASADQYHEVQTEPFDVGEEEHKTLGILTINSFPVRFSDVQPCADLPASGGECSYSVRVWNGLAAKLKGNTWSMVNTVMSDSFVSSTNFQVREPQGVDLDKGKSMVLRFRFKVPGAISPSDALICIRVFIEQGNNSLFNTVGLGDLFCVFRSAQGFSIVSPQEAIALASTAVPAAVTDMETEPVGDYALTSYPIFFSEIQPCNLPADGGVCNFSVKITNDLSTRLSGKAWSIINGSGTGSFIGFTAFQTDTPRDVQLNPGESTTLRFQFRVPDSVADGAAICASVYVGRNPSAVFHPEGVSVLFCFAKGAGGFTLMSEQEMHSHVQQMQLQEATPAYLPSWPKK